MNPVKDQLNIEHISVPKQEPSVANLQHEPHLFENEKEPKQDVNIDVKDVNEQAWTRPKGWPKESHRSHSPHWAKKYPKENSAALGEASVAFNQQEDEDWIQF